MNPTPWTDKAIQDLTRYWNEGLATREICGKLGAGFTRNSVIGKARRLKLAARISGTTQIMAAKSRTKPKPPPKPKPVVAKGPMVSVFGNHYIAPPKDTRPLRERAWEPLEGSSPVLIEDHTSGCVWPIGGAPFKYCNLERHDKRYCTQHAEMSRSKA